MQKEKKLNPKQKIGLERIYRLFELAKEMDKNKREDKDKYIKKYLMLAKRISEKINISIPKEIKKQFCQKCYSLNIKQTKKEPFLIIECNKCTNKKKYSL